MLAAAHNISQLTRNSCSNSCADGGSTAEKTKRTVENTAFFVQF